MKYIFFLISGHAIFLVCFSIPRLSSNGKLQVALTLYTIEYLYALATCPFLLFTREYASIIWYDMVFGMIFQSFGMKTKKSVYLYTPLGKCNFPAFTSPFALILLN